VPSVFELQEEADRLIAASESWSDVATAVGNAADAVTDGAASVTAAGWEGETATAFDAHRRELVSGLDRATETAETLASTLAMVAGTVRVAQGRLDQEWAKVAAIPHTGDPTSDVTFEPDDDEQRQRVEAALAAASAIRQELDGTLSGDAGTIRDAAATWRELSQQWAAVASGGADPFPVPAEGDGTGVITDGDRTVVNTGAGDDEVTVRVDPFTGDTLIVVNGETYRIPAGQEVVIRGGGGDDTITVNGGASLDLTILGSDGTDVIHGGAGDDMVLGLDGEDEVEAGSGEDRVSGGADRDYLDGQDGDDTVAGGAGDDTVYGLEGDDALSGGDGNDYVEGGAGDDTVDAGAGDDMVSGGQGDDALYAGAGDDVTYAGRGDDTTYGGSGDDTANSESGDTDHGVEQQVTVEIPDTTYFIRIEGSDEFVARVEADLEMLRSSPAGQQMLENLQQNHDDSGFLGLNKDTLTIREYFGDNNTASHDGHGNNEVNYNPSRDESVDERPPVVGLYHEMAHVYDYMNGTFMDDEYTGDDPVDADQDIRSGERQAAGLPVDHDGDPDTPEVIDPDHPLQFTENGLRDELGHPPREHYRG
jgi:Ca2+-binding RTX toxin-like protein